MVKRVSAKSETRQIRLLGGAIGEQPDDTNAYSEHVAEKRVFWSNRRVRLLVILLIVVLAFALSAVVRLRHESDIREADKDANAISLQLQPQLELIDLAVAFREVSAAAVNGELPGKFPTSPAISGAELVDASARPESVSLTYRLSSHGQDRCITGTRTSTAETSVRVTDCRFKAD